MFKRPTEKKILDDHIYGAKRMLIDAQFKCDHAQVVAKHHRLQVTMMTERVARLEAARAALDQKQGETK